MSSRKPLDVSLAGVSFNPGDLPRECRQTLRDTAGEVSGETVIGGSRPILERALDTATVRTHSFCRDIGPLLKTVPAGLFGRGARSSSSQGGSRTWTR